MEPHIVCSGGSVIGTDHRRVGRNNQDAFQIVRQGTALAAVVCDGCGSNPDSEIGAKLGARMLAQRFVQQAAQDPQGFVERLVDPLCDVAQALTQIIASVGVPPRELLYDGFLFTFVAVVVSAEIATCFAIGDGVAFMNAQRLPFATFANNAPPYLGYAMLGDVRNRLLKDLALLRVMPTAELESFLIGTDGVQDLVTTETLTIPGKAEVVGPIQRLWEEDRFFRNPDQARRFLCLVNQETAHPNWDERQLEKTFGRLRDDTTYVAGRRERGTS